MTSTDKDPTPVVVAWLERAIDGTAASQHLRGTLARLGSLNSVQVERVVCDQTSADGKEGVFLKANRIISLLIQTASAARYGTVLVARYHPLLLPALAVWRLARGKIVLSVQGSLDDLSNEYPRFGGSWLLRAIAKATARQAQILIAGAPVIADHIRTEMASPGQPVVPIANGVFVEELAAARNQEAPRSGSYAIFVGNLASWQGIDVMVQAVQEPEWPSQVPLVVVGDGVDRDLVKGKRNVIALGRLPSPEAARWYAHAYCAISMKRGDGEVGAHGYWPFKLIESAAVGTPIVCSDAKGMREAAAKLGNAVVVADGSSKACAAAVRMLVDDPEKRRRLAVKGLVSVRQFDWLAAAPELESVIFMAVAR